jgi:multiple sugar transport system permease protein
MKIVAKYLALLLVMAFFMTPILWTAITAVKPNQLISANPIVWSFKPTLEHFRVIFAEDNIALPLINSTIIATFSTVAVLGVAAPAAYALSRFRIPFGSQIASYFLSARMAPPVTVVLPLFLIFRSLDLIDTHLALIAVYVTVNMHIAIWMIRVFFDEIPT